MNTRPFTELSGLVEALCGCTFATQEQTRINYFINRRARRAYAESEFWPRFYVVGEERVVSSTGLLPDEQAGLSDIGTVLRIHGAAPFLTRGAVEYADFYKATSGTQITGYHAAKSADVEVTGSLTPDATGIYMISTIEQEDRFRYYFQGNQDTQIYPRGFIEWNSESSVWDFYYYIDENTVGQWIATGDVSDPISAGNFEAQESASGSPILAHPYSIFATYKAALSSTYGTADGEESDFPEEWFDYAAHGAYADWLRSEAQQDRAALAEQEADAILMQELEKIGRQSGGSVYTRVVTNQNTQWR